MKGENFRGPSNEPPRVFVVRADGATVADLEQIATYRPGVHPSQRDEIELSLPELVAVLGKHLALETGKATRGAARAAIRAKTGATEPEAEAIATGLEALGRGLVALAVRKYPERQPARPAKQPNRAKQQPRRVPKRRINR